MISTYKMLGFSVSALAFSGCANMSLADLKPQPTQIVKSVPAAPISGTTGQRTWVEPAPERMPSTHWVSEFGDPVLQTLVDEAVAANPSVGAAKARLEAAEALAKSARSGLYPTVGYSGRVSHSEAFEGRIGGSDSLSQGGSVSWEADLWGRVRDTAKVGDIDAEASNADLAAARLAVAGNTAQTWFSLIEAHYLTDLAKRNVETQARALRLTQRRFEGGVSGASDFRLARSALASAEATLALRKQNQSATGRMLETLMRRYPENKIKISQNLPTLPPLTGAGAPTDIFLRRPDLLAAERRLQAQGIRVDIANKNLWPRLSLSGDFGSNGGSVTQLFSLDRFVASIAGGLTQPIFQGGALRAELARNEAVLKQQLENYTDTVLTAYREVENALDGEKLLAERERALTVSLDEARQAEERLEARYAEGLVTILQLLDSQTRRINAESALISAKKERLTNRVRLYMALGGGIYGQETQRKKLPKPKLKLSSRS